MEHGGREWPLLQKAETVSVIASINHNSDGDDDDDDDDDDNEREGGREGGREGVRKKGQSNQKL